MKALFARTAAASISKFVSRLSLVALFALAIGFLPSAAHADTLDIYTLSGTFHSGGTLSGTITFDWDGHTAVVKSANIVADGHTFTCSASDPCSVGTYFSAGYVDIDQGHSSNLDLLLVFDTFNYTHAPASFSLYPSYTQCTNCLPRNGDDYLTSGKAVDPPAAPTPEPPAALLFGAGLIGIGLLATARRKDSAALAAVAGSATIA